MTPRERRKKQVEGLLLKAYSRQLQLKYSKSIFETIAIEMRIASEVFRAQVIASQPIPNFKSGIAVVGDSNKKEVIINK